MKTLRICIFALLLASIAFAEEGSQDKSHFFGGHFSFGLGYVWDNALVKGTFGSSKDGVKKASLAGGPGLNLDVGASYWYRLNSNVGFVGEVEFWRGYITIDGDPYGLPPEDPYGDAEFFVLNVDRFAFPVMVRYFTSSRNYLEAGPQFNLNVNGSIDGKQTDKSFDFDAERFGWALVLGYGCTSISNGNGLIFGVRLVMDMSRLEKEGIVEIQKGAAYRESSPMKLLSLQFNATIYFL